MGPKTNNMKKIMFFLSATLIMAACNNDSKTATDPGNTDTSGNSKSTAPALDSATKAANMMAYGTPGAMHKMMASWDGNWTASIKFWVKPELPPDSIVTNSVNKMINNGLIQYSTHDGSWAGMPFNGVSQTGYDNHRGVFWSTWYDNFGSGLTYLEGTWDEATKTISMKGKLTDPETKQQLDMRETLKVIDEKTQLMEQYITHDGKEMKAMEITFRRK
jgi:Protein of unknown function (DUF1579)